MSRTNQENEGDGQESRTPLDLSEDLLRPKTGNNQNNEPVEHPRPVKQTDQDPGSCAGETL